jgi:flagellar biosynthetic protein FliQ
VTPDFALALTTDMIWTSAIVAGPILLLTTLVGLLISVLQVVTQIQEMSLTFVPKLVAVGLAMILGGPWMLRVLLRFAASTFEHIPEAIL